MADTLNLSRPGQVNKSGEADALFMKVFTGEVMTAYAEVNIMKGHACVPSTTAIRFFRCAR